MNSASGGQREHACLTRAILEHAKTLEEELNLRQLLEARGTQVLYVDSISVEDIRFPTALKEKEKQIKRQPRTWLGRLLVRIGAFFMRRRKHR